MTVNEFRVFEEAPEFDPQGRYIAELNNQAVGIIHAHVDRFRKEKKGFIRSFGIVPEFRGKGIEEKLVETALEELKMVVLHRILFLFLTETEDVFF